MKRVLKIYLNTVLVLFLTIQIAASTESQDINNPSNTQVTRYINSIPLTFTENQGQWDDRIQFRANAGGATMWFTAEGAYYQFIRAIDLDNNSLSPYEIDPTKMNLEEIENTKPINYETMMINTSFIGANQNPTIRGMDELEYECNYFIGNDRTKWATNVSNYQAVLYEKIYEGIDLKYYGNGKQMEYDFFVSPGADYSQIKIEYVGVESLNINENGELVVRTMWGEVVEQKPVIYQVENNNRTIIDGSYILYEKNTFGFELGSNFNPNLLLVIDPVLVYSTYLGGSNGWDSGYEIIADSSESAYVCGSTYSFDFPVVNPYQTTHAGGSTDMFITKFNQQGNELVYSTYIGGSESEVCTDIQINDSGVVFFTGNTSSLNFPVVNAYQSSFMGEHDIVVAKLSSTGDNLLYSSYFGGTDFELAYSIDIDSINSIFIGGYTTSTDFPLVNPYQSNFGGGYSDMFVTKFDSSGLIVDYSTFIGGDSLDYINKGLVDSAGNYFIGGFTRSLNFPIQNAFQDTYAGAGDCIIAKLNASGDSLLYSTYIGGSDVESVDDIDIDRNGNVYACGSVDSYDFPTQNPYQSINLGSWGNIFVLKLNEAGDSLVYSTYIGGDFYEINSKIAVNDLGEAYVTGGTQSWDYPILNELCDEFCSNYANGRDPFITKFSSEGNTLIFSTYFTGGEGGSGRSIALDGKGNFYVMGYASGNGFPTQDPFQSETSGGVSDLFIAKFSETIFDSDDDWYLEIYDNCPSNYNPYQLDSDNDGHGDVCDLCEGFDDFIDFDSDGIPDSCDNCPDISNPDQVDTDYDGAGDDCDCCIFTRGNIDGGSEGIDIASLVYFVEYAFNNGPAPPCFEEADLDASLSIDIADIVYLVSFMFGGGPAPVACP